MAQEPPARDPVAGPPSGRHYDVIICDDFAAGQRSFNRCMSEAIDRMMLQPLRKENTMYLYEVFIVYHKAGQDPVLRMTTQPYYFARNEEEAKIKSQAYFLVDASWDPAGVTIICNEISQINTAK